MASLLYAVLALFGIGFLIFIHELGHYFMARRVGITVEVFAIGFGKAIYQWEHKGVKWKLGWLPFGGYVKMAGTEKKGAVEPYQVADGFFGKKPWDRIKVAAMGPIVNIVFAFLAFALLWSFGGRDKPFSDFTNTIGWVEKDSGLYRTNIRPGDQVTTLNDKPFTRFDNLLYAAVLDKRIPEIGGEKIDYFTGEKTPFHYSFETSQKLDGTQRATLAFSSFGPASYLIYDRSPDGSEVPLPDQSPLTGSGISYGDRILWVDGSLIFSQKQLVKVLNEQMTLLTVEREGRTFHVRVPRLQVSDMQLSGIEKAEIDDWRYEAGLTEHLDDLAFIPYNLNDSGVVQSASKYVDQESRERPSFDAGSRSGIDMPLKPFDRIVAVQGDPVNSSYAFLKAMQKKKVLIIVQKMGERTYPSWTVADSNFRGSFEIDDLKKVISQIGSKEAVSGDLRLLNPVIPIAMQDFPRTPQKDAERREFITSKQKEIEKISDPELKERAEKNLELYKKRLMIGLPLQDQLVKYNPNPIALFGDVFQETYRTLFALLTGYLSPKNIMGPVGIVQVIHHSWTVGAKEALFWLGMISLNLGMLNLLPIPVLDGGHIVFAVVEKFTKKPLKAKTMEKLIIPFVVLLVAFFVYLTYHDISRLVTKLF